MRAKFDYEFSTSITPTFIFGNKRIHKLNFCNNIWLEIISMGNMHKPCHFTPCHFTPVFMLTGNKINHQKNPQKHPVGKFTNESHDIVQVIL